MTHILEGGGAPTRCGIGRGPEFEGLLPGLPAPKFDP